MAVNRVMSADRWRFQMSASPEPEQLEDFVCAQAETGIYLSVPRSGRGQFTMTRMMQKIAQPGMARQAYIVAERARQMLSERLAAIFSDCG